MGLCSMAAALILGTNNIGDDVYQANPGVRAKLKQVLVMVL